MQMLPAARGLQPAAARQPQPAVEQMRCHSTKGPRTQGAFAHMRVEPMAKKLLITCEQNPRNLSRTPEIEQNTLSRTTGRTPGLALTS